MNTTTTAKTISITDIPDGLISTVQVSPFDPSAFTALPSVDLSLTTTTMLSVSDIPVDFNPTVKCSLEHSANQVLSDAVLSLV